MNDKTPTTSSTITDIFELNKVNIDLIYSIVIESGFKNKGDITRHTKRNN